MAMLRSLSIQHCIWMVLLGVYSTYAAICQTSTPGLFVTHPLDQTVKEGGNATLTCTASNGHLELFELFWEVHPDIYPRQTFTSLKRDKLLITSRTTVYMIGKTEQNFRCLLKLFVGYPEVCYHSRIARTKVHFFPESSQLSCGPDLTGGIHDGETVVLQCAAPRGNPPVDLRWTIDTYSETDVALPVLSEHGLLRIITINLDVTRDMHLKNISCQVTSEVAFPDVNATCSLGPILVFHKPHVIIYPAQATTETTNLGSIRFQCIAQGFPEDFAYSWSCFPEDTICGCDSSTDSLDVNVASSNVVHKFETINITCSASNSVGVAHNVANLTILQPRHNYTKCAKSKPTNEQLFRLDLKQEKLKHSLNLTCILHAPVSTIDVNFTWYRNGKVMLIVDKKIDGATSPLFSVVLHGGSAFVNGKVIFCKVSGKVGISYITISTCIVVNGSGITALSAPTRDPRMYGNDSLFSPHILYNSDSELQTEPRLNIPNYSTEVRAISSYTKGPNLEVRELDVNKDIDMKRNINIATDENITGITKGSFYYWRGNALISFTTLILISAVVIASFMIKNGLFSRHINARTPNTTALSEEGEGCACIDQSYEVPNLRPTSDEEIALHSNNSSQSCSLCSVYAVGQETDRSASCSLSTCSDEWDESLAL